MFKKGSVDKIMSIWSLKSKNDNKKMSKINMRHIKLTIKLIITLDWINNNINKINKQLKHCIKDLNFNIKYL